MEGQNNEQKHVETDGAGSDAAGVEPPFFSGGVTENPTTTHGSPVASDLPTGEVEVGRDDQSATPSTEEVPTLPDSGDQAEDAPTAQE